MSAIQPDPVNPSIQPLPLPPTGPSVDDLSQLTTTESQLQYLNELVTALQAGEQAPSTASTGQSSGTWAAQTQTFREVASQPLTAQTWNAQLQNAQNALAWAQDQVSVVQNDSGTPIDVRTQQLISLDQYQDQLQDGIEMLQNHDPAASAFLTYLSGWTG